MPSTALRSPCSHLLWFRNNTRSEKDLSILASGLLNCVLPECVRVCVFPYIYGRLADHEHHAGGISATLCPENLKANQAYP